MNKAQAHTVAHEWIAAFNRHDLEAILSHYAESIELTSLLVTRVLGDPAGTVRGKDAVNSVAVYVRSNVRGLQVEVMELDDHGRIARALVHHRDPS